MQQSRQISQTRQTVESRIASLPISEAEREEAIAYMHAGEEIADAVLAIVHFFTDHSVTTLKHTH